MQSSQAKQQKKSFSMLPLHESLICQLKSLRVVRLTDLWKLTRGLTSPNPKGEGKFAKSLLFSHLIMLNTCCFAFTEATEVTEVFMMCCVSTAVVLCLLCCVLVQVP